MNLSFDDAALGGDGSPSSLVVSAPASEVAFDGADELAAVLPSLEALLPARAVRRMILTAVGPVGGTSLPLIARTSSLRGGGLEEESAEAYIGKRYHTI